MASPQKAYRKLLKTEAEELFTLTPDTFYQTGLEPWEKHPGEPLDAYMYFDMFLSFGPRRTLTKVNRSDPPRPLNSDSANDYENNPLRAGYDVIVSWSRKFYWIERAAEFDKDIQGRCYEQWRGRRIKSLDRLWSVTDLVINRIEETVLNPVEVFPMENSKGKQFDVTVRNNISESARALESVTQIKVRILEELGYTDFNSSDGRGGSVGTGDGVPRVTIIRDDPKQLPAPDAETETDYEVVTDD